MKGFIVPTIWLLSILLSGSVIRGNATNSETQACQKLPGNSLADCLLQSDTLGTIAFSEFIADKKCQDHHLINTEVIEQPRDVRVENGVLQQGAWLERWTVNRCGTLVPYKVKYAADQQGGTFFQVIIEK